MRELVDIANWYLSKIKSRLTLRAVKPVAETFEAFRISFTVNLRRDPGQRRGRA
jgi:hypothetical protein